MLTLGTVIRRRRQAIYPSDLRPSGIPMHDGARRRLADAAGVSRGTVWKLETDSGTVRMDVLERVANALGCKVWEILKEADV